MGDSYARREWRCNTCDAGERYCDLVGATRVWSWVWGGRQASQITLGRV